LRHLTIRKQDAVTEQSEMLKAREEKDRSSRDSGDRRRPAPVAEAKEKEKAADAPAEVEAVEEVANESAPAEAVAEPVAAEESETKPEAGE
jgi:hypothetical protein